MLIAAVLVSLKPRSLAYLSAQENVLRTPADHQLFPGGQDHPVHLVPVSNAVTNMPYLDYMSKLLKIHTILRSEGL